MHTICPNRLRTDQGPVFTNYRWRNVANQNGIQLCLSGANAPSSLRIGARLNAPLRRIFENVAHSNPTLSKPYLIKVAVKAMNETMCENGLVPSKLVFGIIPRFPILNTELPNQREKWQSFLKHMLK